MGISSPIFQTVAVASGATPATPPGGVIYVFSDSTGTLKQINDQGTVSLLGGVGILTTAAGAVTVAITNAPTGVAAAPARYAKVPDGIGGFYTFPSLT